MVSKYRGDELRPLIKNIRDGTFEYESPEPAKTKWSLYDSAQIKEMACYLDNLRDFADEADMRIKEKTPTKKRGADRSPCNLS